MFILFRLMNGAQSSEESQAIDMLMHEVPIVKFWFVFFMITYTWTLLSILTAVVSENMIMTTTAQEVSDKMRQAENDRQHQVDILEGIFVEIDQNGDGRMEERELREYFSQPDNWRRCAASCHVPPREVMDVWRFLGCDGNAVSKDRFVDTLLKAQDTPTEKSMLKLEARIA